MRNKNKFSYKTVNQLGIQIIKLLENIHSSGYVYNDLKPDNICIGNYMDKNSLHSIKLIDFGLATPYLRTKHNINGIEEKVHIEKAHKCF